MKNKFLLLTWLLAVPLLWGGCDKPLFKTDEASIAQPDELPPITTAGEGTFACKINGVNWQRLRSAQRVSHKSLHAKNTRFHLNSGAKIKYTTFKKLLPQRCTKPVVYFILREALTHKPKPNPKPNFDFPAHIKINAYLIYS